MAQFLDTDLDSSLEPEQVLPTLDSPSLHPPIIFPTGAFPALADNPPVLGFAPAPTADQVVPAPQLLPQDHPAPLVRPRGRFHLSGYELAVIALILSCAALCIYRLFWAMQF